MKNHIKVEGKLLQTNKKFDHLKATQKEKISEWLYEAYASLAKEDGFLKKEDKENVLEIVEQKIEEAEIWIPSYEVVKYFEKKKNKYKKRFLKNNKKTEESV